MNHDVLPRRTAVWVFVSFASAYFLSALLRAITATLSPSLSLEFGLHARDLGPVSYTHLTLPTNREV